MDSFIPSTSLFLGIIPALILLFISIKGYEQSLKHKNIFLAFIGGIVIGFITIVIEIYTGDLPIYIIVVFPLFEELFKTIILNIGRLQEKPETVIYGLVLGLGFGSVATSASVLRGTFPAGDYLSLGLVVFGSFGIIMLQAATGLMIGYGVYKGKVAQYVTVAIILHIVLIAGLFIIQITSVSVVIVTYLFIAGLVIYWYATKRIMPQILLEGQRRKRTQKEIEIKKT
jgi:hypothetical protein